MATTTTDIKVNVDLDQIKKLSTALKDSAKAADKLAGATEKTEESAKGAEKKISKFESAMDKLKRASDGVNSKLGRFGKIAGDLGSKLGKFGKGAGAAGAALAVVVAAAAAASVALVKLTADTAAAADEQIKASRAAGISVEEYGRLAHALSLSGTSMQEMAGGLNQFNRNIRNAEEGAGAAGEAFQRLGIQTRNADGSIKSQTEVLAQLADQFQAMPDGIEKSALAQDLFGESGARMVNVLNNGSEGLAEMGEEAERLGLVFSTTTAQAAEGLNDNVDRLRGSVTGLRNVIGAEAIPIFEELTGQLVAGSQSLLENAEFTEFLSNASESLAKVLSDLTKGALKLIIRGIGIYRVAVLQAEIAMSKAITAVIEFGSSINEFILDTVADAVDGLESLLGGMQAVAEAAGLDGLAGSIESARETMADFSEINRDTADAMEAQRLAARAAADEGIARLERAQSDIIRTTEEWVDGFNASTDATEEAAEAADNLATSLRNIPTSVSTSVDVGISDTPDVDIVEELRSGSDNITSLLQGVVEWENRTQGIFEGLLRNVTLLNDGVQDMSESQFRSFVVLADELDFYTERLVPLSDGIARMRGEVSDAYQENKRAMLEFAVAQEAVARLEEAHGAELPVLRFMLDEMLGTVLETERAYDLLRLQLSGTIEKFDITAESLSDLYDGQKEWNKETQATIDVQERLFDVLDNGAIDSQTTRIVRNKDAWIEFNQVMLKSQDTFTESGIDRLASEVQTLDDMAANLPVDAFVGFGETLASVFSGEGFDGEGLKEKMGQLIGGLLKQMGTAAIAMGTIALVPPPYNPNGNPVMGAALIAGGIAAVGLGSALGGSGGGSTSAPTSAPSAANTGGQTRAAAAEASTTVINLENRFGSRFDAREMNQAMAQSLDMAQRQGLV